MLRIALWGRATSLTAGTLYAMGAKIFENIFRANIDKNLRNHCL
jgi:hypothetical protein